VNEDGIRTVTQDLHQDDEGSINNQKEVIKVKAPYHSHFTDKIRQLTQGCCTTERRKTTEVCFKVKIR
jgi:hypothetical protein